MNKIAAVSMMKNEADIVESFARHALKIADLLIVTDHNSTDKTRSILESLQNEGLPIIIQTFDGIEFKNPQLINSMIRQAFELGADIVIPIDADEFIIKTDGNSNDVRRILQSIDPSKCYLIPWLNFRLIDPEKDQDQFILSRPLALHKKNDICKVVVGRNSYLENDLFVVQGNHYVTKRSMIYGNLNIENFSKDMIDEKFHILSLHIPVRSREQLESKNLAMGITQTARFSKKSFYGAGYRERAMEFFNGEDFSVKADPNSTSINLSLYKDECVLKYTDVKINPWLNLYQLAEDLADKYNRMQTLNKKVLVSVFVLHYGNAEETISTLNSIFEQTYDPIEIFVMPIDSRDLDQLIIWGESVSNYLELIDYDLPNAIENSRGKYLQFVTAGDILNPKAIEEFICMLEPQDVIRIVTYIPTSNVIADTSYIHFSEFFDSVLKNNFVLDIGISDIFYRREFIPNNLEAFIDQNLNAHGTMLFLESIYGGMIGILQQDNLIDRKQSKIPWTLEDLEIFKQDLDEIRSNYTE